MGVEEGLGGGGGGERARGRVKEKETGEVVHCSLPVPVVEEIEESATKGRPEQGTTTDTGLTTFERWIAWDLIIQKRSDWYCRPEVTLFVLAVSLI